MISDTTALAVGNAPAPRPYSIISPTASPSKYTALNESFTLASGCEAGTNVGCTRTSIPLSVFLPIASNFKEVNIFSEYQLRGMFSYLLGLVLKEMQEKDFKYSIDSVIEKFKNECRHSTVKINAEEFAKQHGYSYVYFRNKFKEKIGEAPSAYAQRERLLLALRHLESGYYNVSEVSMMIGFENVYHFSSAFKKQFGEAPSNFLRRAKKE